MLLALELSLKEKIEKQYEEWMACCPNKKREVDAWIKSADEDEAVCMKYLYAYMHPCDIVSYDVEVIASYVKATLDMYANVPYASGPTFKSMLPPFDTHSTNFFMIIEDGLKNLSLAQYPQLLFIVIHASQFSGSPFTSRIPCGGIICSGLTKSP